MHPLRIMVDQGDSSHVRPFDLALSPDNHALRWAWQWIRPAVEHATGLRQLSVAYERVRNEASAESFLEKTLAELGIRWKANTLDLARIPRSGPCIAVANHPFGAVEGIVLALLLRGIRPDAKVLANFLLGRIPPMREALLLVDPFGKSPGSNVRGLRDAIRHLKKGGLLALFPAGEVAHFDWKTRAVVDPPWNETLAWLVRASGAPVLPVHFEGHNGPWFQLAGLVHPRLRTALLPRELVNKRGQQIEVRIGTPIGNAKLAAMGKDQEIVAYLRKRTSMLAGRARLRPTLAAGQEAPKPLFGILPPKREPAPSEVVDAVNPACLEREVDTLPAPQLLVRDHERSVYWARAPQIPKILREIGRLRELTFREVGEGTGKSIDLDAFDQTYLHLFVFDRRDRSVVGAYRLGPTDELLANGIGDLYTSTLFQIRPELFAQTGPALEMGRSFVRSRYQKSAAGLFLLWRGIGQFVADRPHYRVLFGPVSISNAYEQASRQIMVDFIEQGEHKHSLSRFVRPRHPFASRRRLSLESGLPSLRLFRTIDEVSEVVSDIEPDQKGVPVLFKQYLKLGGKMLGFNVDPQFSRALDGLVL
ncbi:MAG TPA: GNAT family N-acyltransferase, partial [Polyangiaceae bacterium]